MGRRLGGRQFKSVTLENRRCGAGIDQRRRQLPGLKPYDSLNHHSHPPRLRSAAFVTDVQASGQLPQGAPHKKCAGLWRRRISEQSFEVD